MKYKIAKTESNQQLMDNIRVLVANDVDFQSFASCDDTSVTVRTETPDGLSEDVFELEGVESNKELGFDREGATWFSALRRGGTIVTPETKWEKAVADIANRYHEKYSVIAYNVQTDSTYSQALGPIAHAFAEVTLGSRGNSSASGEFSVKNGTDQENEMTYYAVKLRVSVRENTSANAKGSGNAMPLIGRLYFRKSNNTLVALTAAEAERFDSAIKNVSTDEGVKSTETAANIRNAVQMRLLSGVDDATFSRCFCLSEQSKQWLFALEKKHTSTAVTLICESVQIISYACFRDTEQRTFIVDNHNCKMLEVRNSMNGISVYCLNCQTQNEADKEVPLILNNRFVRAGEGEATNEEGKDAMLSTIAKEMQDNLVSTRKDVREAAEKKLQSKFQEDITAALNKAKNEHFEYEFFNHVVIRSDLMKDCPTCRRRSYLCKIQLKDDIALCKDCPHPEVMYMNPQDGSKQRTETWRFAFDVLSMVPKKEDDNKVCKCCGRGYAVPTERDSMCKTCFTAFYGGKSASKLAKKRYRQYRLVLPIGARLKAGLQFRAKRAYEDDGIVLFVFASGSKKPNKKRTVYKFDKLDIRETGYLKKATKIDI